MSSIDPRSDQLPRRVADSINRDDLPLTDDRSRLRYVMNNLLLHIHPSRVNKASLKFTYTWGLGGLAIMLLAILVGTGIMLMFVYTPAPETAYSDMLALQTEVNYGQFIRNLHHWSGNLLVIVTVLHLLRVFFTGGLRPPREFNWVLGIGLLLLVVIANFTGYLLPWDQLAYWAVTVGASLLSYIPVIGDALSNFILGGPEVSGATLTNFYGLHVAIIPMAIFFIASFHIWRVRKDALTVPRNIDEAPPERLEKVPTLPHLVSIEFVFALVMMALLVAWAAWINAPLEAAADPNHSPNPAKAAWYFMGIQELLLHFHPVIGAIIIPALGLGALIAFPYLKFDSDTEGIWFGSRRGRRMAWFAALVALIGTPLLVILDEYVIDFPALLPTLPTLISNGVLPLLILLVAFLMFGAAMKALFRANRDETRQALFVLLVVAFVVLTVIGVAFRGEGMALMWPWEVL
ncbi:MAG: cytochrome b N-terminal domain-containing protein [Anaerolineaceae bacterium]|nr:cytochrome b N-terminal domain-containing protein [Anaerolineaceae bacterium]